MLLLKEMIPQELLIQIHPKDEAHLCKGDSHAFDAAEAHSKGQDLDGFSQLAFLRQLRLQVVAHCLSGVYLKL